MATDGHHGRPEPVVRAAKEPENRFLRRLCPNSFRSVLWPGGTAMSGDDFVKAINRLIDEFR